MSTLTRAVVIVQARMSSSRLPGKVLLPLAGKPIVWHIWERLSYVEGMQQSVIATTAEECDKPLRDYCSSQGINVFAYNGHRDNLLERYIQCGDQYNADIVVLVCGDCPLIHPPTISRMISVLREKKHVDYCRPEDASIEGGVAVLRLEVFKRIRALTQDPAHKEHAALFVTEHPELFNIEIIPCEDEFRLIKHRLWLDTPADYRFLSELYRRFYQAGSIVNLVNVVKVLHVDAKLRAINEHVKQKGVRAQTTCLLVYIGKLSVQERMRARQFLDLVIESLHFAIHIAPGELSADDVLFWKQAFYPVKQDGDYDVLVSISANKDMTFQPVFVNDSELIQIEIGINGLDAVQLVKLVAQYLGYAELIDNSDESHCCFDAEDEYCHVVSCPLCANTDQRVSINLSNEVINCYCSVCGHAYIRQHRNNGNEKYRDFRQHYTDDYLLDKANPLFALAEQRFHVVRKYFGEKHNSLLEIGAGYGHFLSQFSSHNAIIGIEPSKEGGRFARSHFRLMEYWQSTFEDFDKFPPTWPQQGFSLICSFHVLEHIPHPRMMIKFIRDALAENGLVCLAVPNLETVSVDFIEGYFYQHSLHLHTFSQASLRYLLQSEGFEVIDIVQESPIAMLRSSMLVLGRKIETTTIENISPDQSNHLQDSFHQFHQKFFNLIRSIESRIKQWKSKQKHIAIYGGGVHTRSLVEFCGLNASLIDVIVDDDVKKQGDTISGIEICSLETAIEKQIDVVVVSSLAAEYSIKRRLHDKIPSTVEIWGVYELGEMQGKAWSNQ